MAIVAARTTARRRKESAPRSRMPRELRARQLLDLAESIVLADGLRGFTMERLAGEAGVAKTVVYSHFANASELGLAILKRRWSEVDATFGAPSEDGRPLEEELRAFATVYLDVTGPRRALRTLMTELARDPVVEQAVAQRLKGRQASLAKRLEKACGLAPGSARMAAAMVFGALSALSDHGLEAGGRRAQAVERFVASAMGLLEGLRRAS
ncbi:MAG: TetR/AcrR family transcriptional regulator [Alphaproteobacteria bacterium]|nr:TetR/AcrR family transcriptional regulator [Alphaproteobacteria bacterium]